MTLTVPRPSDFPSQCNVCVIQSTDNKSPSNVLLLLHGLGDNVENFGKLGRQLNLPETLCIAIQAPSPLPFDLGGYHWGDDIVFDQCSGDMDMDTGFGKSTKLLSEEIIEKVLVRQCGFRKRQIHFFGFGQGGMAAIDAACISLEELGGVVSIGGPLPAAAQNPQNSKSKTPLLLMHGIPKSAITVAATTRIKSAFEYPSFYQWKRPGDAMPSNREEMLPIMQFLARRLRSRAGVPADAQEVT